MVGALAVGAATSEASAAEVKRLFIGVGSMSAENWVDFVKGATQAVQSVDPNIKITVLQSDFQGQKLLSDLSSAFAGGCSDCIALVDTASIAFTKAIVEKAHEAGAKIVTVYNRPEDIHPWDTASDTWVANIAFNATEIGKMTGKSLCDALGGKGNIAALGGVPDNPPAKRRLEGLNKALEECPGVKLLDTRFANWAATEAQNTTRGWISRFGDDLNGVFGSNDAMGMGAIAALRESGLNGKVKVTGGDGTVAYWDLITKGDALSTVHDDNFTFGAYGAALAYAAAVGDISLDKLSHEQRDFYLKQKLVGENNVAEVLDGYRNVDLTKFNYDALKKDFWAQSAGQIGEGDMK
ncbi:sugar ABC transporter substrate-binding protein [Mesorhizobium sp. M0047]|uniref:sugar ABC transporter substrate-binding protein n=1 Tax=Mesorhizobium sp. M0047 TaxID=2956859 RepID=UPI00333D081C